MTQGVLSLAILKGAGIAFPSGGDLKKMAKRAG